MKVNRIRLISAIVMAVITFAYACVGPRIRGAPSDVELLTLFTLIGFAFILFSLAHEREK